MDSIGEHRPKRCRWWGLLLLCVGLAISLPAWGQQTGNGPVLGKIIVPPSPPPPGYVAPRRFGATPGDVLISNVPAYSWVYGCSPTAAGMLVAFLARHNYPHLYTGPAGVVPLFNETVWGATQYPLTRCGEAPFIASHQSIDGRTTRGHVDDYYSDSGGTNPYLAQGWIAHADDCLADDMGTSRSVFGNATNGSTTFYYYADGTPLSDYNPSSAVRDGCHGIRAFITAQGYTVTDNYTQVLYNATSAPNGYTFAQYCAEIDAGNPVIIQLNGHTMLGMGYNKTGNIVYVHTTWGNTQDQMTWGGTFQNMTQWGVTVIHAALPAPSGITATQGTRSDGVAVSWSGLPVGPDGQCYYCVYRGISPTGSDRAAISNWLTSTTYTDSSAVVGTTYTYWVAAASSSSGAQVSPFSSAGAGWRGASMPVNDPPTINAIPNQIVNDNSGAHTLTLAGITPGDADDAGQTVTISALSSRPSLVPNPIIAVNQSGTTGTLTFTPAANASGTALITVTLNDSGGTANGGHDTTVTTFLVTVIHHQADMGICNYGDSTYLGAGVYNLTGVGQTKSQAVANGATAIYIFRVWNAGQTTDAFTITVPAGLAGWKTQVIDRSNGADVTTHITSAAGLTTIPLAPGVSFGYTLYVTPNGTVAGSALNTQLITAVSVADNTRKDAAVAVTSVLVGHQPDVSLRNAVDTAYLGVGIYNTDGTNQTKSQAVAAQVIASYLIHVQNNGNTADSFTLTSPSIVSGWTAAYYDAASGANITTSMTGAHGWTTGTLAPGAITLLVVQVTPSAAVTAGATASVLLTATSAADATKKDAVKLVTTRQ